jgi:hypothetical protein
VQLLCKTAAAAAAPPPPPFCREVPAAVAASIAAGHMAACTQQGIRDSLAT